MRARAPAAGVLGAAVVVLGAGACGTGSGAVSSYAVRGHVIVDGGNIPVLPGQSADFTAFATVKRRVRLISAAVVPVSGYRAARLAHAGIVGIRFDGDGRGWPGGQTVRPLAGAEVGPGRVNIAFGITGTTVGTRYATAGIRLTYRDGGVHQATLWSAGVACVVAALKPVHECNTGRIFDQVRASANS